MYIDVCWNMGMGMLSIYLYIHGKRRKSDAAPVHFSIGHDVIHELIFIINEKRRQTITIIKSAGKGKLYRKQLPMNRSFIMKLRKKI